MQSFTVDVTKIQKRHKETRANAKTNDRGVPNFVWKWNNFCSYNRSYSAHKLSKVDPIVIEMKKLSHYQLHCVLLHRIAYEGHLKALFNYNSNQKIKLDHPHTIKGYLQFNNSLLKVVKRSVSLVSLHMKWM